MYDPFSKNNVIASSSTTAAGLFTLGLFVVAASIGTGPVVVYGQVRDNSLADLTTNFKTEPKAPLSISANNIYIAWWTNNTSENGNEEVMFRASNDGGQTFGDKVNLSNSPDADSSRVEIAADGANVIVSWWERTNQTSHIPVARMSIDGGQTFGPMLMLATNGTISGTGQQGGGLGGIIGGIIGEGEAE